MKGCSWIVVAQVAMKPIKRAFFKQRDIAWAVALFAPPASVFVFALLHSYRPRIEVRFGRACLYFLIVTFLLGPILRFGFTQAIANFVFWCLAYFCYCYFAVSRWQIKTKWVRFSVLALMSVPIAFGYLMGTIGILGLGWILMDKTASPMNVEQIEPGLVCEKTGWGAAATDSGYNLHLYRRWSALPFVRREVEMILVNETALSQDIEPPKATCHDLLVVHKKR